LQEFACELHVLRVVRAQDDFRAAVRDETIGDVGLLRCADDGLAVLAHLTCQARWHAQLAPLLFREDIMRFIKDEDVPQDFALIALVFAQEQDVLQKVQAHAALLIITKPLQLKHDRD
jgi:hypothetical protein